MKSVHLKIESFLKQLKNLENASSEEREKAVHLLGETLENKNVYILKATEQEHSMVREMRAARRRLEDIHERLELSIKSGNANGTIH